MAALRTQYDREHGGFGGAPKFPPASALEFLLRRGETEMTAHTLRAMASGGMYDQVGGGFARYSVDAHWLVPHFEKMLYDNALLARAYLHGWQVTGDPLLRQVTEETLDWALHEMRGPEGGFASALDADSEGVEGKFYVWSVDELRAALADEPTPTRRSPGSAPASAATSRARTSSRAVPIPPAPRRRTPPQRAARMQASRGARPGAAAPRSLLSAARPGAASSTRHARRRVWPGLDDKRLTSWNALMIAALADAGAVLEREDYLDAARACADFVLDLPARRGRPAAAHLEGRPRPPERLPGGPRLPARGAAGPLRGELRAALVHGRARAGGHDDRALRRPEAGGFFETSSDHERLVARRKDLEDHPIPSGNASAAYGLLRLAALSGEYAYEQRAVSVLRLLHELAPKHPQAFGHLLQALDFHLAPVREVALVGDDRRPLERVVRDAFRPHLVLAGGDPDGVPLLADREPVDGRATAYVCERFACKAPVTEPAALEELLR